MPVRFTAFSIIGTIVFMLAFAACNKDSEAENLEKMKAAALEQYADIASASYQDCLDAAVILTNQISAFTANPTEAGFQACKTAWLAARIPYGQTEAYRFYGGPIDRQGGPEGLLNAWPMDENFVDYVQGDPNAGLINNPQAYPVITEQVLMDLNESISEESIFTGFHAIEFLLWGQDLSDSGPGARPYTDYVSGAGGTAANPERRAAYLLVLSHLLENNLEQVLAEWAENGAYRTEFLNNTPTKTALGRIFTALGELSKGELAGERMFVAIDTKDQENEHSCFSDNTLTDIKMNFLGLKNVWSGVYVKSNGVAVSGTSFKQIAEKIAPAKAKAVNDSFAEAETHINVIPLPFDHTIVYNGPAVVPAIDALRLLSDRLTDAGLAIGAEF